MNHDFRTDAQVPLPAMQHERGCRCRLHSRRLFTGGLLAGAALPTLSREGVEVGKPSAMSKLVSADQVEKAAASQYQQMRQQAAQQKGLAPDDHPQLIRLRAIAKRIIPHTYEWNPRAQGWKWEVSLIGSSELNAFCMPGGKIGRASCRERV